MQKEGSSPRQPHRIEQLCNPQDAHDPAHVVGQAMQANFGTDMLSAFHQKVRRSHPELEGAKNMLYRAAPKSHCPRLFIQSRLHGVENLLMLPTPDASLWTGGAFCFLRTLLAV